MTGAKETSESLFCSLGHRQRAMECPACGEALTGKKASLEHWRWYRGRTSSKAIRDGIDAYLQAAADDSEDIYVHGSVA